MNVLLKPIITEKSLAATAKNLYTFAVTDSASKRDIRRSVEELFNVKVLSVKTIKRPGEQKRDLRTRKFTRNLGYRKAVVKLPFGQKIDLFETGETR